MIVTLNKPELCLKDLSVSTYFYQAQVPEDYNTQIVFCHIKSTSRFYQCCYKACTKKVSNDQTVQLEIVKSRNVYLSSFI